MGAKIWQSKERSASPRDCFSTSKLDISKQRWLLPSTSSPLVNTIIYHQPSCFCNTFLAILIRQSYARPYYSCIPAESMRDKSFNCHFLMLGPPLFISLLVWAPRMKNSSFFFISYISFFLYELFCRVKILKFNIFLPYAENYGQNP